MPSYGPTLWTLRDLMDYAVDYLGGAPDEKNQRRSRVAIQAAYRELVHKRNWNYFYALHRVQLVAPYSTGTIVYDHTGGANEREVTLTSGTWPEWALYGHIKIGSIISRVASMVSSTVITLESVANPGQDVAAGTSYTLFRDVYTLPFDYRCMCRPVPEGNSWYANYLSPEEFVRLERNDHHSGTPTRWTVMGEPNLVGSSAIFVYPYPSAAATFDFLYQRSAKPLERSGYVEATDVPGTITGTAGAATVTGTSTAFDSSMIGCSIRRRNDTRIPTGFDGLYPWVEQRIIIDCNSTTDITVDANWVGSFSGVKYVISDPVDLPPRMLTALLRGIERELGIRGNMDGQAAREELYRQAVLGAMEADSVLISPRYAGGGGYVGMGLKDMPLANPLAS